MPEGRRRERNWAGDAGADDTRRPFRAGVGGQRMRGAKSDGGDSGDAGFGGWGSFP